MSEIQHAKYGPIAVRRFRRSRYVRLSVAASGNLQISAPLYTPLYFIKQFLKKSEQEVEDLFAQQSTLYLEPMQIGKSHRLEITEGAEQSGATYKKPLITVRLGAQIDIQSNQLQREIRGLVAKALRIEAKAYLPRRFELLSLRMGLGYSRLRFSHSKTRWGSCSSEATVSLNIALMKLPFELIDYVIIHELAHLSEMNHSAKFWSVVARFCPDYKSARKQIKNHSPQI